LDDLEIYELILSKNLSWEGLLRDIVKKENINPWEIDINFLSDKYREALNSLKNIDFRLSGKFLLASAILLRMKSDNFKISELSSMSLEYFDDFFEDMNAEALVNEFKNQEMKQKFREANVDVTLRLPRERVKPISLDDLVDALKEAMVVKERRDNRKEERKKKMNYKIDIIKVDIASKIKNLYSTITGFFENVKREEISFAELVPSKSRKDQLWTFVPLLHLTNEGKIDMHQKIQFGEIKIRRPNQLT